MIEYAEHIKTLILSGGAGSDLGYLLYTALSVIAPPLVSVPLWPAALWVWGLQKAIFLTSFGSVLGAMVAYALARVLGRPVIIKLIGDNKLERMEKTMYKLGWKGFFILRLLAGNFFDVVSYAAGLSGMPADRFFVVTTITSVLWIGGFMASIQGLLRFEGIGKWVVLILLYGIGGLGMIYAWREGQKEENKE